MPFRSFVQFATTIKWPWFSNPISLGELGEIKAARYLKKKGLRVVERGYRNSCGEIDLIAVDQRSRPRSIVFMEVKTRRSVQKGTPEEAVGIHKQNKIIKTAMVYLKQNNLLEARVRFDIVGIIWPSGTARPQIEHYINAFQPSGIGQMFR